MSLSEYEFGALEQLTAAFTSWACANESVEIAVPSRAYPDACLRLQGSKDDLTILYFQTAHSESEGGISISAALSLISGSLLSQKVWGAL